MLRKTAIAISAFTHPIFMFFYIFVYLFYTTDLFYGVQQIYKIWHIMLYLFINSILIPLILIFFFEKDFNIEDRRRRNLPYLIMLVIYILIYVFFQNFLFPAIIKKFLLSIAIGIAVLFLMNSLFKISMHTTSAGASIALFLYLYSQNTSVFFLPLMATFVIAGIMGSSRLYLKVHTRIELYIGYLVGLISTLGVLNNF